jgi:hypothetical protein
VSPDATKTNGASDKPAQDERQVPPLFYSRPMPVSQQLHKAHKIRAELDFAFSAKTNAVPLTVPEFSLAARHYPIIFIGDELVPSVALGMRQDDNLFVDVKGGWEQGQYIPAYIRRFPFILLGAPGDERLQLGIDDDARSNKPDARSLFDGEKETETVTQALSLCEQFHGAFMMTAEFSKALAEAEITESRALEMQMPDGTTQPVVSFVGINEEKFRELPDATFLDWRKKGWLHAVYFHLQSLNNWEFLMARAASRMAIASAIA